MAEAVNSGYPVMVSAAAFYRGGMLRAPDGIRGGEIQMADVALDSAGFTAMAGWAKKGLQSGMAGIYPWSLDAYTGVVAGLGAACSWWSQPDFCCEPQVAADASERRRRVELTARSLSYCLQETQIREVLAEAEFIGIRDKAMRRRLTINASIRPPVPVIQGWTADDYRYSADLLRETWEPWQAMYQCDLIGVGSVCRRPLHHKQHGVLAILRAIEDLIPPGTRLHLFGVKGAALELLAQHPLVASADSMAYDFNARMVSAKARRPNTMKHRIENMHRWMDRNAIPDVRQPGLF